MKPPWDGPAAAMVLWVNYMLDQQQERDDNDDGRDYSLLKLPPLQPSLHGAIEQAHRGNIDPLKALCPSWLRPFLAAPKLKKGSRFPSNPFLKFAQDQPVQHAVEDVRRIRRLWKDHYDGKRNRPRGDSATAVGIAAERHNITVDVLLNAMKNSPARSRNSKGSS